MTPLVRGTPSASSARTDGATRLIKAWTSAEPVKVAGLARLAVGLRGLVGMRVRRRGCGSAGTWARRNAGTSRLSYSGLRNFHRSWWWVRLALRLRVLAYLIQSIRKCRLPRWPG